MNKILEFFKTHKYAIIWTICYTFITWAILYFLFNFDMFCMAQWRHLMRAQLRGFPGFVFGILILSALPLHIATTTLIIRNKKPLITIPVPKIKIPTFIKPTITPDAPTPESDTPSLGPDEVDMPTPLPADLPAELRVPFIRARNNLGRMEPSRFNNPTPNAPTSPSDVISAAFPLPNDFDIPMPSEPTAPAFADTPTFAQVPTFTDISFDTPDTTASSDPNSAVIDFLTAHSQQFTIDQDIIITDTMAIITHDDSDFWVTDNENWFAAGKTRPSPIATIQSVATTHNKQPVLYLASQNILDLEKLIPQWESAGIRVITNLSDL